MKIITINSDRDYFVYGTGYSQQILGENVNSLRVNPSTWIETAVLIHKGIANYPADIANWDAVKGLKEAGKLTISPCSESEPTDYETETAVKNVAKAEKLKKQEKAMLDKASFKKRTLDELTDQIYVEQAKSLVNKAKEQNGEAE